jgi:hypothetical protein
MKRTRFPIKEKQNARSTPIMDRTGRTGTDGIASLMSLKSSTEKIENYNSSNNPTCRRSILESKVLNLRTKSFAVGRTVESIRKHPRLTKMGLKFSTGPTIISTNIVLGSREDAADIELMKSLGVTHILNVAKQVPNYHETSGQFIYMKIDLLDSPSEDMIAAMARAKTFIERAEELDGRVFIHCIAGVSRSVTVVVMYFIIKHQIPLRFIYNYVQSCRAQIAVNDGFKLQCTQLELEQLGCTSVSVPKAGLDWDFYGWNK